MQHADTNEILYPRSYIYYFYQTLTKSMFINLLGGAPCTLHMPAPPPRIRHHPRHGT